MALELDLSGLFELFPLSIPAKSKSASPTDPYSRKTKWEEKQTSLSGLELWLPDWELLFEEFQVNWSFNFTFNFLLDMYLSLDFHLEFDFSFDFKFEFGEFIFDEFNIDIGFLEKAYYDKSEYGQSYFDPEELNGNDLRKFTWWLRYKTTDKKYYTYKYSDVAAKNITETNKNLIYQQRVRDFLLNGFEETIAKIEGKIINSCYVGFAIVGISKVPFRSEDDNSYGVSMLRSQTTSTRECSQRKRLTDLKRISRKVTVNSVSVTSKRNTEKSRTCQRGLMHTLRQRKSDGEVENIRH